MTPQLELIHRGKVRDSFRTDPGERMIVATDRISVFDRVLESKIDDKGAVLSQLSAWWFEKTRDIIPNHLIKAISPNIHIVKEADAIPLEMIVRGYITGSMWRGYEKGKRIFSGVKVPDGLVKDQKLPAPIITPTTKEESDREITPDEIVAGHWVDRETLLEMYNKAAELFEFGTQVLEQEDIILVDTKYEFGFVNDELILIDEIHTPDSSRFWDKGSTESMDKEYVRRWYRENGECETLPSYVIDETRKKYTEIFCSITGEFPVLCNPVPELVADDIIRDGYVIIVMGSQKDEDFCEAILEHLNFHDLHVELRVVSAHKNGEDLVDMCREYNDSIEPGVAIAVAGLSNGLGGALAANLNIPVINCPPGGADVNLMSSLSMPSYVPCATVLSPKNAAEAAMRCLNIPRLRRELSCDIRSRKEDLRDADEKMRS